MSTLINYAVSPRTNTSKWSTKVEGPSGTATKSQSSVSINGATTAIRLTAGADFNRYGMGLLLGSPVDIVGSLAGRSFTLSFDFRASTTAGVISPYVLAWNAARTSGLGLTPYADEYPLSTSWTHVTLPADYSTGSNTEDRYFETSFFFYRNSDTIHTDDWFEVTNVQLTETSSEVDYFDGSTTDTDDYLYEWEGAENLSPSYRFDVVDLASLSLVALPSTGAVRVRFDPAETGAELVSLTRTDRNGTGPVRTVAGLLPADDITNIVDYEAAIAGDVTYSAQLDDNSTLSATITLAGTSPWLSVAVNPSISVRLDSVMDYSADRQMRGTVHTIVGRADPIATFGPLATRSGTFEMWCETHADADAIERVYNQRQVVLLRVGEHEGMDCYHVATNVSVTPYKPAQGFTRWAVRVQYTELARPVGSLLGALGWTFDDVLTNYASFNAVMAEFEDFDALEIGPTTEDE